MAVRELRAVYGRDLVAVDDVSLDIRPGEIVGLVGESGCGKSSLARCLAGLRAPDRGAIFLKGQQLKSRAMAPEARRAVQMVFQDPAASLDPRLRVRKILAEPLRALCPELGRRQRRERIAATLEAVGLEPAHGERFAHSFSGGQAQRIAIARALIVDPELLICDEPLSALDVSVQAQILNLLRDLRARRGMAMLFISHDLAVVRQLCDRLLVMYLGRLVEQGATADLIDAPAHPYTRALLSCVPRLAASAEPQILLEGELPDPRSRPSGCVFRTRCPMADAICAERAPDWHRQEHGGYSACHFAARHASPMTARALP
jgi:oligopeptide/dipeptide ABC transporter ATP-binding protein